jgi:heptosyltransferase-1
MGDVLHAMPAVAALQERHPEWQIDWAIEPRWSELLEAQPEIHDPEWRFSKRGERRPLVDRWISVPTREWKQRPLAVSTLVDIRGLRQELRRGMYDVCVDMQGAIRSAVVGRMAGAGVFAGLAEPREAAAAWLYGRRVKVEAAHVVEQGCELLGGAVGEVLRPAKVALPVDAAAELWCDELMEKSGDGLGDGFAVMAPTAGWGAKQWPAERYGAVAVELGRAGFRTLVNAASPEDEAARRVVEASGGAAMVAPCTLGQMIALMRRARVVIAGDTGPLHLAAVLERPVVALFGPTDPERNGPYGMREDRVRVLRHGSSRRDHSRRAETEQGLMQIRVEEVTEAAFALLRAGQDTVKT